MNKNTQCEARDIFVRFRDMILYVLLRWKSILVVALVVALLAAGVKFWQDTNRYNAISQAQKPEQPVSEPLDAEGLAHVALVQRYQWNYDSLCAYNTAAPMMQIDFQAVPTQQMSYLVTGTRSFAAATLYRESLRDEMLYASLAEELSTEEVPVSAAHLMELVSAELVQDTAEGGDCVFVQVRVIAPSKELCDSLSAVVRKAVASVNKLAQQQVGNSYGRWVFDRYGAVRSEEVRDLQFSRLAEQEKALTDLKKATDNLTAAEEDYLFVNDHEEEPTWSYPAPSFSLMTLVLGFIGGGLVMALWYAVRYLYCGRVLSAAEVEARYGLAVFGAVAGNKKQNPINRLVRKLLQEESCDPALLWERMALVAEKAGVHTVHVVGDEGRLDGLSAAMASRGVTAQVGTSPLANPEAMAEVSKAEALIVTIDLEETRHKQLAAELELARQLDCPVLGVVLMKQ